MDVTYSAKYATFRSELRAFLEQAPRSADSPTREVVLRFWEEAVRRGYAYRAIPRSLGGSEQPSDALIERILQEELFAANVPPPPLDARGSMIVHTLLDHGSEAQKRQFIPASLRGEFVWCQGYSEPDAGSDLAALQSSALLDGDQWVINGQKIWTSGAHESNYMFGLFRTEPEAPKHAGISYLLIDMQTPGIEIAPMKQMDGGMDFNQVFFSDVRVPADHIVGKRGEGWAVSRSTLKYERNIIGNPNMMRQRYDALIALARETRRGGRPAIEDPSIRQRLAELEGYVRASETSNLRMLTAEVRGQEMAVALLMMSTKLYATDASQRMTRIAFDLTGDDGMLAPTPQEVEHVGFESSTTGWVKQYMAAIAHSIAGGASNIQRNIIGERGLGLPRDLRSTRP